MYLASFFYHIDYSPSNSLFYIFKCFKKLNLFLFFSTKLTRKSHFITQKQHSVMLSFSSLKLFLGMKLSVNHSLEVVTIVYHWGYYIKKLRNTLSREISVAQGGFKK